MKKRIEEPNYDMLFDSAVNCLRCAYSDYKRALIQSINSSGIDNEGNFFTIGDPQALHERVAVLEKDVVVMKSRVEVAREDRENWRERNRYTKKDGKEK